MSCVNRCSKDQVVVYLLAAILLKPDKFTAWYGWAHSPLGENLVAI